MHHSLAVNMIEIIGIVVDQNQQGYEPRIDLRLVYCIVALGSLEHFSSRHRF